MRKHLLILVFALFSFIKLSSQAKPFELVNSDTFISETQFSSDKINHIEMFWWLPTEFWKIIYSNDPLINQNQIDEIVNIVDDYLILAVIKGKIGMFGGVNYESYNDLKSHIQVKYKNEFLNRVESSFLSMELNAMISMFKPILSNMLGNMGENLHFFVFDNPKNNKLLPVDPLSYNDLMFLMDSFSVNVDLPLSSLLLEKICPEDKAKLNGKWIYCPFHGSRLISQ